MCNSFRSFVLFFWFVCHLHTSLLLLLATAATTACFNNYGSTIVSGITTPLDSTHFRSIGTKINGTFHEYLQLTFIFFLSMFHSSLSFNVSLRWNFIFIQLVQVVFAFYFRVVLILGIGETFPFICLLVRLCVKID